MLEWAVEQYLSANLITLQMGLKGEQMRYSYLPVQ